METLTTPNHRPQSPIPSINPNPRILSAMDLTEAKEHRSAGELDDETMARKRSRRVSFAETTAVHVFDRDDDSETPPSSGPAAPSPAPASLPFQGDNSDSDDSKASIDDDDDEDDGEQQLFVRDMDSSSPGSAMGSVTSNDDDNFFGPVSASFIRSGRLSESGMSEDNEHDITLDSTAFSLHFRNLVPPDDRTVGSIGTPATDDEVYTNTGGSTVPQGFRKRILDANLSDGGKSGSNSMSLVVENPNRYDYGKMSPRLEALLAEVDRCMEPNSPNNDSSLVTSSRLRSEVAEVKESRVGELNTAKSVELNDMTDNDCSAGIEDQIGEGNNSHAMQASPPLATTTTVDTQAAGHPMIEVNDKDACDATKSDLMDASAQNSELFSPSYKNSRNNWIVQPDGGESNVSSYFSKSSPGLASLAPTMAAIDKQPLSESECGIQTPKNVGQPFQSPLLGSLSSLHAKRQRLFLDDVLPQSKLIETPSAQQPPSSLEIEHTRHNERISAIKNKISQFKISEMPVPINSISALSGKDQILLEPDDSLNKTEDPNLKHMGISANKVEDNLINSARKPTCGKISVETSHSDFRTSNNGTQCMANQVVGETGKLTDAISCIQFPMSDINVKQNQLATQNPIVLTSTPNACDSSPRKAKIEFMKNSQGGCFTPRSEGPVRSNSLLEENGFLPATPFNTTTPENERTLQSLKELASNDITLHHFQEEIGSSVDLHLGSQDINILMKEDLFNVREKLPESEMFAPSYEPSGDAYKEAAIYSKTEVSEQCLSKPTAPESTQGLCDDNDVIQGLLSICEPFPAQGVDIVKRKRRIIHSPLIEKDHMKERAHKSPKLIPKDIGNIPGSSSGDHVELNNEANIIGGQTTRKHWTDIISRVSEASKQLFPPSTYKLISLEVDLEDVLDRLQKARKYERICTSLRNDERLVDPQKKRLAEARSLHDKLVFEQVKLQLKRVKLDLLHSKSQLLQSRIQECHKLKSSFSQHCCRGTASRAHEIHLQSDSSNSNSRNQVARNKVDSMRQELEMLDQKVKLLVKSFESLCNIKENMDCNEIINVVNEHLEATNSCRLFRQDLQLWELSDIVKKNNQSDIVLNYRNLLFQRFTTNNGPISSITVSNLLKDANIDKCFPNMNACLAFEFVFKAKDDRRMADLMCFQQETFVTSLLLGTILEMLEEVRASQIALMNLIYSAFHSPCCGRLELHLCFMSFKTGRKITLALDTTNLECAVYPSNPSELQLRMIAYGEQSRAMLPTSVFDEITNAVQGLEVGRPMISRLCLHISQVVQASSC